MPGLIRKLLIFSTLEGLVLQSHGTAENHKAILIDYKTRKLANWNKPTEGPHHVGPKLESHGIIGLVNIAALSFLVAITGREQVAQIYGKPIFVITDIALLPLSSRHEADQAIVAASQARSQAEGFSDSDLSDDEAEHHAGSGPEVLSPFEEDDTHRQQKSSTTSIAKDVARRQASYGKFASEWFSKRVWGSSRGTQSDIKSTLNDNRETVPSGLPGDQTSTAADEAIAINQEDELDTVKREDATQPAADKLDSPTMSLLPKVLRSTKIILSSRSFYFSYDYDLTRRLSQMNGRPQSPSRDVLDAHYFWNRRMGAQFLDASQDAFLTPIVQGFVGQRTFSVKTKTVDTAGEDTVASKNEGDTSTSKESPFLLTLISRRSVKRSGLRYLRRGIDDEGNCANSVETEQILSSPSWEGSTSIRSFVQIRGSIPLYFSQSPYSLKPVPSLHNSASANQAAFRRHFQSLHEKYGTVQIAMLVDKHGTEVAIGNAYEQTYKESREAGLLADVNFEWFDFHAECRGMKFENVERLVTKFKAEIASWGETVILQEKLIQQQTGVIRTNCMDCLDRTNVAQSAFGQHVLQRDLEEAGFEIDLVHDESTNWFNTLWADNGDAISRQYASTAALKGDFTRTRKRNWQGAVNDLGLTLSRYYSNMVNDYFSQTVIDVLLGNVSWKIFEEFESTMMSADPGISVSSARQAAIENCAKIVIQEHDEDLIHGWTMLSPAQENTLRTLPLEETVVLLTDAAVYCCKFDWNTEKLASFEKVDLRSISKIRHGTYITSTFTQRQMDEELNQGLVLVFTPGKEDVIRVNTRSLQNNISPDSATHTVDGGTGLLSWFSPGTFKTGNRTMALKVIPQDATKEVDEQDARTRSEPPRAIASHISDEIRRAIEGPASEASQASLVEPGDIISVADAKRRTGYLEHLGHSLRRMVWA